MDSWIPFRSGNEEFLAAEYIELSDRRQLEFDVAALDHPQRLAEEDILAVHDSDSGAQGDAGAVEILYRSSSGVQIMYGNYAYGDLNLNDVIQKLPFLRCLDSRGSLTPPYPFGGKLEVPTGWGYVYMGAMNHLFIRKEICDRAGTFMKNVFDDCGGWQLFRAVAWFCGAKEREEQDPE